MLLGSTETLQGSTLTIIGLQKTQTAKDQRQAMTCQRNDWRFEAEPSGTAVWKQEVKYKANNCFVQEVTFESLTMVLTYHRSTDFCILLTGLEQQEEDF